MLLGDNAVTSVHVLFDESIPERTADYFNELEEATLKVDPEKRRNFDRLVGKSHMDEGLMYNTTRVVVWRGLIVDFCALVTAGRHQIEDKTPIHIADLQSMTEDIARRLRKKRPGSHDDDAGVASTVARKVMRPAEPEASSGRETGSSDVLARIAERVEDAVNAGRRVRKQRVLTNVSSLGEIHLVESDHIPPLQQEAHCILMVTAQLFVEAALELVHYP